MEAHEVIDVIYSALRKAHSDPRINDATRDNDHKSAEIILTTDDGKRKQVWVLSSSALVETDEVD